MVDAREREELAAYALGLLGREERSRVEAHVHACAECAEELAAYRNTIELLPEALPFAEAPRSAWSGVSAQINDRERRARSGAGSWLGRLFGPRPWLQPALLAVFAAAVLGLIGWNASLQHRLSQRPAAIAALGDNETVVDLLSQSAGGLTGHLIMSENRQKGGLVVAGLPALPAGQSYEIWFVRSDQTRVPAGSFGVDSLGQAVAVIAVPQPAGDFAGVAITREPAEGSPSPTGPDVLAGPIYE